MGVIRAAVVQVGSLDLARTLVMVRERIAECVRASAQLVVFPEVLIGGYPKGRDFGVRIGVRTDAGRAEFRRYFEGAIEVPGPETAELAQAARDHQVLLVIGVVERAGGTLYCTVLFFSAEGTLLGRHRKVMPTAMERVVWGSGDGSTLPVFASPLGRIGAVICWENYMPLLRMHMYAQGVQLYCAPTVDDRDSWVPSMRHVATEGRCFVLSACQFMPGPPAGPPLIRGGSVIVDPFGKILAGPVYGAEGVATAELDLDLTVEGKFDLDVAGHYARPDIFRFSVNDSPSG